MRSIPPKIRKQIDEEPYYKKCARLSSECSGRITIEHSFIYSGRQVNELWALLPLCWHHHLGSGLDKRINEYLSLQRATEEDLAKYPKRDWKQLKKYLSFKYEQELRDML
jgi:hypothetical protein